MSKVMNWPSPRPREVGKGEGFSPCRVGEGKYGLKPALRTNACSLSARRPTRNAAEAELPARQWIAFRRRRITIRRRRNAISTPRIATRHRGIATRPGRIASPRRRDAIRLGGIVLRRSRITMPRGRIAIGGNSAPVARACACEPRGRACGRQKISPTGGTCRARRAPRPPPRAARGAPQSNPESG